MKPLERTFSAKQRSIATADTPAEIVPIDNCIGAQGLFATDTQDVAAHMKLLEPGTILRDTYEVERFLGEGAFAEVYRVKHRFLGRQALKVFKRVGMSIEDIHEMLGEAILLSRIGHPNIVRVFDANVFDSERGQCGYFTMEHVAGGSLQKFWQSHGRNFVPIETSLDLTKQICRGLSIAHRENPPIVHRDIKPQNILVGYEAEGLRARVSDFGLAKSVNPLTLLATTAGTLSFKPPEAFADGKRSDSCASDVWGIGATLYMLLTDRLPGGQSVDGALAAGKRQERPIVPPSQINPDVSGDLDRVVLTALRTRATDRFPTAGEFLTALEGLGRVPEAAAPQGKYLGSEPSKAALGAPSESDGSDAEQLVAQAIQLGSSGHLPEAADVMEEALNKAPALRAKYADKIRLWRRGISM